MRVVWGQTVIACWTSHVGRRKCLLKTRIQASYHYITTEMHRSMTVEASRTSFPTSHQISFFSNQDKSLAILSLTLSLLSSYCSHTWGLAKDQLFLLLLLLVSLLSRSRKNATSLELPLTLRILLYTVGSPRVNKFVTCKMVSKSWLRLLDDSLTILRLEIRISSVLRTSFSTRPTGCWIWGLSPR